MDIEKTLNWLCEYITYWYSEKDGNVKVHYPVTKDKQELVKQILDEQSDFIIYKKKCYYLEREIEVMEKGTSYFYYMKPASAYRRKKGCSILPYNIRDNQRDIVSKLIKYYKKEAIPFSLIMIDSTLVFDKILDILNPFSYINTVKKQILKHCDICIKMNNKLIILFNESTNKCLDKKQQKINKIIKDYNKKHTTNIIVYKKNNDLVNIL